MKCMHAHIPLHLFRVTNVHVETDSFLLLPDGWRPPKNEIHYYIILLLHPSAVMWETDNGGNRDEKHLYYYH